MILVEATDRCNCANGKHLNRNNNAKGMTIVSAKEEATAKGEVCVHILTLSRN